MANKPSPVQIEQLRSSIAGQVILPGDADYDAASALMLPWIKKQPAAIVKVKNADDVIAVVNFCREHGVELAVRSGGHSAAGHSSSNGGAVIDLTDMHAIDIDVDNGTVWVEAGSKASPLTHALAEHGYAVGFGDTGSVGIGGITLGGGVGYLVRKHGLTIDNLLAADVVTADGRLVHASVNENPDLFWALRGGGGNFGVATRFKYRMHKSGQGYGGMLVLPATADVLAGFMSAATEAPEELSCIANVMTAPPMPFLPAEMHGKVVILAILFYAGEASDGERALAPFVNLAVPFANMLASMRYADLFQGGEEGPGPAGAAALNMHMRHVDVHMAQVILDRLNSSSAAMAAVQLRPLGGAMARVHSLETAYAHRKAPIMVNVAAIYNDSAEKDTHTKWAHATAAALDQGEEGVYVNFLGDEGPGRVRAAYPGLTWERLAQIKKKYDPDNLFRLNQNIFPAKV